jgi:hypothetical protein
MILLGASSLWRRLSAGVTSGVAGLLAFLVVHHVWIAPIWFVLPLGLLVASVGGVAVGLAYFELAPRLPARPWRAVAVLGAMLACFAPGMLLSLCHGPLFEMPAARIPPGQGVRVAVELLVPPTLTASLIGWWWGRSGRAAAVTALAGLALALGPGHNVAMFGADPLALKGHAIVIIVCIVAAITLVEADALLERWRAGKVR